MRASTPGAGSGKAGVDLQGALTRWADLGTLAATGSDAHGSVSEVASAMVHAVRGPSNLTLVIHPNLLIAGDRVVFEASTGELNHLPFELYRHGLRRLTFDKAITETDMSAFLACFVECVSPGQIGSDLATSLYLAHLPGIRWRETSAFAERLLLSDDRVRQSFGQVIATLVPEVAIAREPDLLGDVELSPAVDGVEVVTAIVEQARAVEPEAVEAMTRALDEAGEGDLASAASRIARLLAGIMVKSPCPLSVGESSHLVGRLLDTAARTKDWALWADLARSFGALAALSGEQSGELPDDTRAMLNEVRRVIAGPGALSALVAHLDDEGPFYQWLRWHLANGRALSPEHLLEALEQAPDAAGPAARLVQDLLKQRGLGALKAQMTQVLEGASEEVSALLDRIEADADQTTPGGAALLRAALGHHLSQVRARAAAALGRWRPSDLVVSLGPLLDDGDATVRRAAMAALVEAGGADAAIRLATVVTSPAFALKTVEEQMALCEALGALGGDEALNAFLVALGLDRRAPEEEVRPLFIDPGDGQGAVLAGLARLEASQATRLFEALEKASPDAGAWFQKARRLAARPAWASPVARFVAPAMTTGAGTPFEGAEHLMGRALLFDPAAITDRSDLPTPTPGEVEQRASGRPDGAGPVEAIDPFASEVSAVRQWEDGRSTTPGTRVPQAVREPGQAPLRAPTSNRQAPAQAPETAEQSPHSAEHEAEQSAEQSAESSISTRESEPVDASSPAALMQSASTPTPVQSEALKSLLDTYLDEEAELPAPVRAAAPAGPPGHQRARKGRPRKRDPRLVQLVKRYGAPDDAPTATRRRVVNTPPLALPGPEVGPAAEGDVSQLLKAFLEDDPDDGR